MNYKNIKFHNNQSDALDAKIKEPQHIDQICTVKVNPCNLMPKQCEHDKLILTWKSHWNMF